MICLLIRNQKLRQELVQLLSDAQIPHCAHDPDSDLAIPSLYSDNIQAAIVEASVANLHTNAWLDMLESIGSRIRVYALSNNVDQESLSLNYNSELIGWLQNPTASQIFSLLINIFSHQQMKEFESERSIPLYTPAIALRRLETDNALSILKIDGTEFQKIAIKYGIDAYNSLHTSFKKIVESLWGGADCLRLSDLILKKSNSAAIYYVLLEQSRVAKAVPSPGVLETVADRISIKMQEALWLELAKSHETRTLPKNLHLIPEFSVGHATILFNPCVSKFELLATLLEAANDSSKLQRKRIASRELELMQTIVQSKEILVPHFQGIFHLSQLTKTMIDEVVATKSIASIEPALYGFESLIRTQTVLIDDKFAKNHLVHVNSKELRPDTLFAMAKHSKVALELDQVCLEFAMTQGCALPGKLLLNILPRNLLQLSKLQPLVTSRENVVFEISESEGISNPDQMQIIRQYIIGLGAGLAVDDFGKGQANIEQIIKLRPDLIKIDRSLLENIHLDPIKKVFVEGVIKAGRLINALVLAEGIEKWEEAEVVQKLGIDLIQGFLVHRPESAESIHLQLMDASNRISAA